MSKRDQLKAWLNKRRFVMTSEIIDYGSRNYWCRADREARDLRRDGFLRRLTKVEKKSKGFNTKQGVYEVLKHPLGVCIG